MPADANADTLPYGNYTWTETEVRGDNPRIYVVENFFSAEECEYLKEYGRPLLKPALTIDPKTGKYLTTLKDRTNSQGYAHPDVLLNEPAMRDIVVKLHTLARVPLGHSEHLQIGRYQVRRK